MSVGVITMRGVWISCCEPGALKMQDELVNKANMGFGRESPVVVPDKRVEVLCATRDVPV